MKTHRIPSAGRAAGMLLGLLPALAGNVWAQANPVGLWKTFDDDSGKARSLIRIVEAAGRLTGRIEKLLDAEDPPDAVCDRCRDERRNHPILGLTILRDVGRSEGGTAWEGGDILDPENGRVYRVRLVPSPDGRRLDVRGYIGSPLLGRSQTWQRVE